MNAHHTSGSILMIAFLAASGMACGRDLAARDSSAAPSPAAETAGEETSDLDRPVEELFTEDCEHGVKMFACDECRYEVGVARVAPALLEGGLVRTAALERRAVAVPLVLTGEVQFDSRRVVHVGSQTEGTIVKVGVTVGDHVRKGQALVELESIAVGEAQSAVLEARAMQDLARREFERVSALRAEAIASEKEFLQADQALKTAEIRLESAAGRLERMGGERDPHAIEARPAGSSADPAASAASGAARGRLTLRAPAAGAVLAMHAVPGEIVHTDEPLVTLGDNGTVWIWADLYERDIAAVSGAQAARPLSASVTVQAWPGTEFRGTVDLIQAAMDETSRTVKVRIVAENPEGRLLAGMFARVRVFLPGEETALAVPAGAVLEDEARNFVFIRHHDDFYVRRPVKVGRTWEGWCEVLDGLSPEQVVVSEGAFLLKSDVLRSKMGAGCAD